MFLFYILIIAACIAVLFYILFNARPSVEPKIKNGGESMALPQPPTPALVLSAESHPGLGRT